MKGLQSSTPTFWAREKKWESLNLEKKNYLFKNYKNMIKIFWKFAWRVEKIVKIMSEQFESQNQIESPNHDFFNILTIFQTISEDFRNFNTFFYLIIFLRVWMEFFHHFDIFFHRNWTIFLYILSLSTCFVTIFEIFLLNLTTVPNFTSFVGIFRKIQHFFVF